MQINMEVFYKLTLSLWVCATRHSQSTQNKTEFSDEVDFLHADKHQIFLKVCFRTLGIKVSYKVDVIIINRHDQAFSVYSK